MNILAISCVLTIAATANAYGSAGAGLVYAPGHSSVDYYSYPKYAFEYSVKDPHTGDNKAQWEKRDGDVVKGAYSLVEPDGSLRVVEYWADDNSGFNAVVKRLGPNLHPVASPVSIYKAPIPVLSHTSPIAPITVGPVAKLGHLASAPLISGHIGGGPIAPAPIYKTPIAPIVPVEKHVAPLVSAFSGYNGADYADYTAADHHATELPGPIYKSGPIYTPIKTIPTLSGYSGHPIAPSSLPLDLSGYDYVKSPLLGNDYIKAPVSEAGYLHDFGHGLSNSWHGSIGSEEISYLDKH